ncbi:rhomboid family intramembrane serine protease [Halopiger xanaduensis]|uniref:Rhomboid family protein n=1 Tax=Halopiger xanaduensis (strain DSM 18323 / JCM 14033 / SH-6) TaxID=797210 RepID=F8D830_HALXS|nr:rhomboid family intramembrane serine protease [Halopiger xanaduensis]AEH37922.1 Rhomboid family protein [Halopiger xanaduensis SH-6]
MRWTAVALAAALAATFALSLATVSRLDRPARRWRDAAGERLVAGVPWGTLVVVAFVVCVYLFVQDGITDVSDPVTIPYRAWSFFYPLGLATAAFAHADLGHLVGNMAGTVVAAPIAEYAWGHYVPDRDADATAGGRLERWRTNPWVRALVLFPLAVIGIGLLTSVFALGPIIGFSGVVFAIVAFAIVHYPIATLIAAIGAQSILLTVYRAIQNPVSVHVVEQSPPTAPGWAGIAIQGHALGFFIGLVLGAVVLERRGRRPNALHVWLAILIFAFSRGLWQIYWYGEGNSFILFRGPGVVVVTVLALVITIALAGSDEPVVPRRVERFVARLRGQDGRRSRERPKSLVDRPLEIAAGAWTRGAGGGDTDRSPGGLERIRELAGGRTHESDEPLLANATRRSSAFLVVLLVLAVLAGTAIPVNLAVYESTEASSEAIQIEDYTVEYAEEVENGLVSGIGVDAVVDDSGLEASGVIVSSERRNIWMEAVTSQRLSFTGEETIAVGGPGWRETVHVERVGWEPVGNEPVYQIRMWEAGEEPAVVHESTGAMADVLIENRLVTITSQDGEFVLEVASNETGLIATTPLPEEGETTRAGGLAFEREDGTLYAATDGTAVAVASKETYD